MQGSDEWLRLAQSKTVLQMAIDLDQLRTFVAVADVGGLSAAAET
jgi:hypothetical protein